MASAKDIPVYIDWHHKRCADGLRKIALLGDTMSEEHFKAFNTGPGQPIANGWRVAEKMREIANDAIGICDDCGGSKAVKVGDGEYVDCPCEIQGIKQRCEANELTFDNNDMSQVLSFAHSLVAKVAEMQVYKDACDSMARQLLHPKMTGLELAQLQLKPNMVTSVAVTSSEQQEENFEQRLRLRQDIEEAIEQAADCVHDAPQWWAKEDQGPRTIDTLISMIVMAAERYAGERT